MNYFCAAIKREILDKKVFSEKEEAFSYFEQKFGLDNKDYFYVWKEGDYRKRLTKEPMIRLFKICGVYRAADYKFEVLEEQYVCMFKRVENVSSIDKVFDFLPESFKGGHEAMIIISETDGESKVAKFISKMKMQIINAHRKSDRRVISAA